MIHTLLLAAMIGQTPNVPPTRAEFNAVKDDVSLLQAQVAELQRMLGVPKVMQAASVPPVREFRTAESLPTTFRYSSTTETCTGPGCAQQSQGWYLGKNLGRKK